MVPIMNDTMSIDSLSVLKSIYHTVSLGVQSDLPLKKLFGLALGPVMCISIYLPGNIAFSLTLGLSIFIPICSSRRYAVDLTVDLSIGVPVMGSVLVWPMCISFSGPIYPSRSPNLLPSFSPAFFKYVYPFEGVCYNPAITLPITQMIALPIGPEINL